MTELIINPLLQTHIDAYITSPSHALLLYGKKAVGKKALARHIAESLKQAKKYSKVLYIYPLDDKKFISVDQVKQLKKSLRTKDESYRVIVIPDTDTMTHEAQNSFLKLLEEPPQNVLFILTSSFEYSLLATVRSRLLKMRYIAPTEQQQREYIAKFDVDATAVNRLLAIAGGRMGLLSALVDDGRSHSMLKSIELAKDILGEPVEERLVRVDALAKDVLLMQALVDALLLTCSAALSVAIERNQQYTRWLERLDALETANNQIAHNIHAKLVLSRLFLVI